MFKAWCLFFLIPILLISYYPSFAQTEPLLTVDTAESSYEEGDSIIISGRATTVIVDIPITIQVFYENNLVEIAQLEVAQDGSFTHTIIAEGPLWSNEGEYIVRTNYGEGNVAEATFDFLTKSAIIETKDTFEVDAGSFGTYDVEFTINGGVVSDMLVDAEIFALVVIIESDDDGSITLKLPREYIDALKPDGTDEKFIILIDGIEIPYEEIQTSNEERTIKIEFDQGDSDIEIIGTFAIPEFGTIAVLILVVALASIIVISKKKIMLNSLLRN